MTAIGGLLTASHYSLRDQFEVSWPQADEGVAAATAKEIVADMSHWHLHVPAADDVLAAIGIHQRTGISFWDAMIVRSAAEIGCAVLYSEDLNAGQEYSGVCVENPFRPSGADRA